MSSTGPVRPGSRRRRWVAGALLLVTAGCAGAIVDPPAGAGGRDGGEGPVPSDGPGAPPGFCDGVTPVPGDAPLRRLTPAEYTASVQAVFPGVDLPDVALVGNALEGVFANDVRGQAISGLLVEQLRDAAVAIAGAAVANDGWRPCPGTDEPCLRAIAGQVGERAYRRALTEADRGALGDFVVAQAATHGPDGAVAMLVEALLQAPGFLYKPEVGDPDIPAPEGLVALTGDELANRLAYFLTGAPPDADLRGAAARGRLDDAEGLEAEARRLLETEAARAAVASFHRQWLHLRRIREVDLDDGLFPAWNRRVRDDLEAATERFLDATFWEDGTLAAMFSSRRGWVTDATAEIFGVPAPGSDELVPVTLPEAERAGILTQPGLLASTSHGLSHAPILRGVLILDAVLCTPSPPPPPDVLAAIPEDVGGAGADAVTTRQKIENTHGTRECAVCHEAIDGMGFSFENYDAVGRFVTEEHGEPVDPTGLFRGETVDGALSLTEAFAEDPGVAACMATQWYRFALGRNENGDDRCQVQALADRLTATGGDLQELVVALVTSNAFRFRPAE